MLSSRSLFTRRLSGRQPIPATSVFYRSVLNARTCRGNCSGQELPKCYERCIARSRARIGTIRSARLIIVNERGIAMTNTDYDFPGMDLDFADTIAALGDALTSLRLGSQRITSSYLRPC